ncbi:MAG: ribose 5-phosphate isomerase B [Omnitrophica WOR_2 bacterium RBG_13_41_10]|nr:MAG: ribose 5-phosphate isomerase B [Omnitrophica WOR_2 bacterium RBG_13_41_10]
MKKNKNIIIASDHRGFILKEKLKAYLEKKLKFLVEDLGVSCRESCDYPLLAYKLAKEISRGAFKQGILICYSGIGNAIVANKFARVRAALCYNVRAAKLSRQHNDSNILVLGAAFVNEKLAQRILDAWLKTQFAGGRHQRRLNQIKKIEREIGRKKN